MKHLRLLLPFLLLLVAAPAQAAGAWTASLTNLSITYLAVDQHNNNTVYAAGNDASQNAYVYRSTDGGVTWTPASQGLGQFTVFSFASSFTQPERLLIGGWNPATHQGAFYKSNDGGNSWTSMSALIGNQPAQAVAFGNDTADTMFAGTDQQLWVSYDGGSTFTMDRAGACPTPNVHAISGDHQIQEAMPFADTFAPTGSLYLGLDAGTCGGVFVSPDSGTTLINASNGLPGLNPTQSVLQLAADTNNRSGLALAGVPAAAHAQTGPVPYSLWKTQNHGLLWTPVADTDTISSIVWDGANDFNAYYTSTSGLYASHNQGATFNWVSNAGASGPVALMSSPSRIIVGGAHGVGVFDLSTGAAIPTSPPAGNSPAPGSGATAASAGPCQYILGFATLHTLIPTQMGSCVDNQVFSANGDAVQHSRNGLLVWRKADNWTAFTNGYLTWINGPNGLASRLNTVRFAWEANPDHLPIVSG